MTALDIGREREEFGKWLALAHEAFDNDATQTTQQPDMFEAWLAAKRSTQPEHSTTSGIWEKDALSAFRDWTDRRGALGTGAIPERIFFAGFSAGRRAARSTQPAVSTDTAKEPAERTMTVKVTQGLLNNRFNKAGASNGRDCSEVPAVSCGGDGVAQQVKRALQDACNLAMRNTLAARIPECGDFGAIAQDLSWALDNLDAIAIERAAGQGGEDAITDAMADAGAQVLYGATRAQAVNWVKQDKFDSEAERARKVYAAMRAAITAKESQECDR
jgi:hypothetical protein